MFKPGSTYRITQTVKVCCYAEDCLLPDMIDLPAGTELIYFGPDNDPESDNGEIFANTEGTKFCLHSDDLTAIEEA